MTSKRDTRKAAQAKDRRRRGEKRQVLEKGLIRAFMTMPKVGAHTKV